MEKLYRDKDWLKQKYEVEKLTFLEIAEICNSSPTTICHWVKRHSIQKINRYKNYKITTSTIYKDKNWLKQKYIDEDLTSDEISILLNVTSSCILRWLKRFDIKKVKYAPHHNKDWLEKKFIEEDLSVEYIAKQCGISAPSLYEWLKKFNIKKDKTNIDKEALYQLYIVKKMSFEEIITYIKV